MDESLERLDLLHRSRGDYEKWMLSEERAAIAGPNHKVRVLNWSNLYELSQKTGFRVDKMIAAHKEALETGDVIFIEYEEDDGSAD